MELWRLYGTVLSYDYADPWVVEYYQWSRLKRNSNIIIPLLLNTHPRLLPRYYSQYPIPKWSINIYLLQIWRKSQLFIRFCFILTLFMNLFLKIMFILQNFSTGDFLLALLLIHNYLTVNIIDKLDTLLWGGFLLWASSPFYLMCKASKLLLFSFGWLSYFWICKKSRLLFSMEVLITIFQCSDWGNSLSRGFQLTTCKVSIFTWPVRIVILTLFRKYLSAPSLIQKPFFNFFTIFLIKLSIRLLALIYKWALFLFWLILPR